MFITFPINEDRLDLLIIHPLWRTFNDQKKILWLYHSMQETTKTPSLIF